MDSVTVECQKARGVAAMLAALALEVQTLEAPRRMVIGRDITGEALRGARPSAPEPISRVQSALRVISSDCSRDLWLKVCFATAEAIGPADAELLLIEWSMRTPHRYEQGSVEKVLQTDRTGEGITRATLFKLARDAGWKDEAQGSGASSAAGTANAETDEVAAHVTDRNLAVIFVRWRGDRFRFDHSTKRWRVYVGGAWKLCRKGEEQEAFRGISPRLIAKAAELQAAGSTDNAKKVLALAMRAESASGIAAALQLASSDPKIASSADEYDNDPDRLNVANGVVHLPTGELCDHDPALMQSRQCPVSFVVGASCDHWLRFLREVTVDDADLIDYLQRICGYMLSGHVSAEKLFFMLGYGANGKSVFANVVRHILGDYAVVVPSAFLMLSRRDGGGATPELAMIAGARLVLANEVEAGTVLSGQMVKVAVSTEHITARPLYGAPFTFAPTHKLCVRANHKPIVRESDEGIWRRIDLIPFERNFAPAERDEGLEAKLLGEAPGILAWMVRGFRMWQAEGLRPARRVELASRTYRQESDLLRQWLNDRCAVGTELSAPQKAAYANYQSWCTEQGMRWLSKKSFTAGLKERGYSERRESVGQRRELYSGFEIQQ